MLFSSAEFLFLFLPLSLGIYFLCPLKWRNLWLFLISLLFYGFGEPVYVFLMLLTIAADYFFGLALERSKGRGALWLWTAVIFNLSLLGFFKYYPLLAKTVGLPSLSLTLPIGISFYTFQALSYVIDVYRKEVRAQKSFVAFGTYVSLFPQLIAGPIVRYGDIDGQLTKRSHSVSAMAQGFSLFCVGLAKKVLLANSAGATAEALSKDSLLSAWLGLILFALQIYYDFSGYSDMATGLGAILGFKFPRNFNYPYISTSITEFWRRWHMTLSYWFREYVYIPLGGNRKGRWRTYFNLLVVWSLTGLWHGAEWSFLFWGIYFFVILVLEKTFLLQLLERLPFPLKHCYALFFILVGWQIFSAEGDIFAVLSSLASLFNFKSQPLYDGATAYVLLQSTPFLVICLIGATPLPLRLLEKIQKEQPLLAAIARLSLSLLSLILSTAYLVSRSYDPFLYFRF